ncbi:hypothetical protein [Pseudomonas sp. CFBP 13602]|uniref:hypothetical protein n=1 Tax=Pseudomonas sp. CFBP 13602 TaxID=2774039 RepID=UPI00177C76EA|nr:hypothetical protein [Pseudomonas sp. CFBP 13602]MBD8828999.1 hypothetical protein [Pseudomonas sp. CFBP 13602]
MQISDRASLISAYETEIETAYAELLESFLAYLERGLGDPKAMAGRCGAQVAAAHKRCKRGLLFSALMAAQGIGMDITPTVAEHLCSRLIGRGVDVRAALKAFGTPGRTAADKSTVSPSDLGDLEKQLGPQIQALISDMTAIRERYREAYAEKAKEAARGYA